MGLNKGLLHLLANAGLLDRGDIDGAGEGQILSRSRCPVHHGGDNPTAFVLASTYWLCNTRHCHEEYGGRLEGLVVALADRYGADAGLGLTERGQPAFRPAKCWLEKNAGSLREAFEGEAGLKVSRSSRRGHCPPFSCTPEVMRAALLAPSWYFTKMREFQPDTVRAYDIGEPHPRGRLKYLKDYAVVPLYDLDGKDVCVGYAARAKHDFAGVRWRMSPGLANGQRLFNYRPALEANRRSGRLLLVEGVVDSLRCVEAGFPEAVAVLGSQLLGEQFARLTALRLEDVVVVADHDEAGRRFAAQVERQFSGLARGVRVISPAPVKDVGAFSTDRARAFLTSALGACPNLPALTCESAPQMSRAASVGNGPHRRVDWAPNNPSWRPPGLPDAAGLPRPSLAHEVGTPSAP